MLLFFSMNIVPIENSFDCISCCISINTRIYDVRILTNLNLNCNKSIFLVLEIN